MFSLGPFFYVYLAEADLLWLSSRPWNSGPALNLPVDPRSYPHFWSQAMGNDRNNEIPDTSVRNEFPQLGVRTLSSRLGEKLDPPGRAQS